ncbi:hypothetical protein J3R83DRAFT_9267 [Lanmaoa asiatica]|nr:hypothetical protein J3R83DRAFT_9267 [Lanmaoa asiatica]
MTPPIFASPPAAKAVVTLVLIENSQGMLTTWNDLRQHYLPTLLGTMRMANPVVPIPVLWLTTAPVGDDPASLHSPPPRQYNQLPELKFSFSPDNKITSRIINRATEVRRILFLRITRPQLLQLMLEAATQFQDGPVSFHLFVVAASSPAPGTWGVSITMPTQIGQSEWRLLGQRMAQLGIHCHMILPASQDMSSMNELFTTSLELQRHTQVSPWFPTSSDYSFLLSGNPSTLDPPTIEPVEQVPELCLLHPFHADLPQQPPFGMVTRPPVLRHQSFPQDVQSAAPAPVQNNSMPSLVSSLQKVHGLSRKKLYGTQPPRQPFVREEPVRTKYKSTPTPLSIPVGSQSFPTSEDGRPVGKTKVERGRRADRPPHIGDVSNSSSPGRRSPWNRVSSDVGSSPSSPTTSLSSHHTTSPTIPLYPDLAGYPTSTPTTSASFSPSILSPAPIPETSFSAPLRDPSGGYFSTPPPPTAISVSSHGPSWTPSAVRRHSQELPHGSHMQSLSAMSSKYRLDNVPTEPRPSPKNTQKVKDAGDVPFIFSPELEVATAAKLKAALRSTSPTSSSTATLNQFSTFTLTTRWIFLTQFRGDDAAPPIDASSQPPPPQPLLGYNAVQTACPTIALAALGNGHINGGDGEPHTCFVGSTSSSSLQGWAG